MKDEGQNYLRDIVEIRSMMERTSRFVFLSGWAGIMAGVYALIGAYLAWKVLGFNPDETYHAPALEGSIPENFSQVIYLALGVFILATITAVFFSYKKANGKGEQLWNPTSKRLLINILVPFITGGILILILISKGLVGLVAPFTLIFYGLALYNASKFTYEEVRILGLVEIALGLISTFYVEYGLLIWAIGFGVVHIIYGIYMHYKYEK